MSNLRKVLEVVFGASLVVGIFSLGVGPVEIPDRSSIPTNSHSTPADTARPNVAPSKGGGKTRETQTESLESTYIGALDKARLDFDGKACRNKLEAYRKQVGNVSKQAERNLRDAGLPWAPFLLSEARIEWTCLKAATLTNTMFSSSPTNSSAFLNLAYWHALARENTTNGECTRALENYELMFNMSSTQIQIAAANLQMPALPKELKDRSMCAYIESEKQPKGNHQEV